ncbi:hypothetical protein M1771_03035 [Spiroplasma citri]|uniref:Transmembrane protein n=1 Tax=Spiroplasma citri TaxID=2133 RepID=A0AAX3T071_SPICI|nr:hypothetical protein [Spiroplasma citri]WFG96992.1 hypothetical protein M0C40_03040 [Spiroplasma citri]WFH00891.1 hypothetical protein M1771_03035 [Spiroplasma citri]
MPGQKTNISQKITGNVTPIQTKSDKEETYDKKFDIKQNENKKIVEEVNLIVSPDKASQFYDEIDTMEIDQVSIMQIISYSFLLIANILMLAAVLKSKKERS